jgi:hypothetical protein
MARLIATGVLLFALSGRTVIASQEPAESGSADTSAKSEQAAGKIWGQVVLDQGGAPVPQAEVILDRPFSGRGLAHGRWRMKTDAQGRFTFEKLESGRYDVWAVHEKLTSLQRARFDSAITIQGEPRGPVELRLRPGVAVSVRVKAKASGEPVANARVHLTGSQIPDDFLTDREGVVRLPFRLSAESWPIDARADGLAMESQELTLASGKDREREFLLPPGGVLEGTVRDSTGEPVSGAGVSATRGRMGRVSSARSDEMGRYQLENLPLDVQLQLTVYNPNFQQRQFLVTVSSSSQPLDVALERRPHSGPVSGIVVDQQDRPVAGAELIDPNFSAQRPDVRTGPSGRFRLEHLYEGEGGYQLIVVANTFSPAQELLRRRADKEEIEVKFVLEPGHRIQGRVVDEQQQPLAGVTVFYAGRKFAQSIGPRTTTDKDGLFELHSLPADLLLGFSKEGYSRDGGPLALDGQEEVTVELSPQREIAGKVVDAGTGKPIAVFSVSVSLSARPGAQAEFQPRVPGADFPVQFSRPSVYRSDEGNFKLKASAEPRQLFVSATGYERASVDGAIPQVPGQSKPIEIRLQPIDPANLRTFAGRLLNGENKPIPQVEVRLIATELQTRRGGRAALITLAQVQNDQVLNQPHVLSFGQAITDGDGHFEIEKIPATANLELVWWGESVVPGRILRLDGLGDDEGRNLEIVVPRPARITGKIDRTKFPDVGSIRIESRGVDLPISNLQLDRKREQFEFTNLPAGTYVLRLVSSGAPAAERNGRRARQDLSTTTVTVAAGDTIEVEFKPPARD